MAGKWIPILNGGAPAGGKWVPIRSQPRPTPDATATIRVGSTSSSLISPARHIRFRQQ